MSVSLSPDSLSAVAGALRAAGCVFAEDEAALLAGEARTAADLSAMVERRVAGLPLEQVLGWAEFCGLRIAVQPGVFVPRRRTEFLAREAVDRAREAVDRAREAVDRAREAVGRAYPAAGHVYPAAGHAYGAADQVHELAEHTRAATNHASEAANRTSGAGEGAGPVVVDLCCGSGAAGAVLAAMAGRIELHAVDIDPVAVRCARRNLASTGGHVYQGDLFEPLPAGLRGRVDVLVANAPYVPTREVALLPAEAREHEPRVALDGGEDGLHILRRVAEAAPHWLAPGGHVLVESSERQAPPIAAVMARGGLSARVAVCEELDTTVIIGMKPATQGQPAQSWSKPGNLPPNNGNRYSVEYFTVPRLLSVDD